MFWPGVQPAAPLKRRTPTRFLRAAAAVATLVLSVAACTPAGGPPAVASNAAGLEAVVVASQLIVGEQRVPIGILDRNTPVRDARVRVRAYRNSPADPQRSESDASFKGEGLEGAGVYVARLSFGAPGRWTTEITAQRPSGQQAVLRVPVMVTTKAVVPWIGDPAPRSRNLTSRDVPDLSYIDSGKPPNDMHELSIAEAIEARRPALVVFATPAFCQSAMCGPQVQAVQRVEPVYRGRLAFIHVEVFQDFRPDPSKMHVSSTVLEWRLPSEPWVFLIDSSGIIRVAFEGPTAADELRTAIERMLAVP